jgi:TrmH family RNA methyltransferase
MIMPLITSPSNPRISKLKDLHTPRGRKKQGLFLMEGPHLLEVLLDQHITPREVYYQPALLQRTSEGQLLLERMLQTLSRNALVEVSERVIEALGEVQTSQGVISVLALADFAPDKVSARRKPADRPALLILDGLSDPGNMGTILRTALAADVAEALVTPESVDCFNPKVVRSAAGAHCVLPIWTDISWSAIEERIEKHCANQRRVLLAEAGSPHLYFHEDLCTPFALVIGNEAHGPSQAARLLATRTITIPLANNVESLNAAMAAGIILYEAVRQRYSQK